ncbi:hypothetical protein AVEN_165985-1 [Araneus ventricosus]|uniref:Uncharacterized protein n=1 Tax=Araneus ventricosus TaxID=182803 RepID=A0A4Y2PNC4_ARAVE|nr:hypothetical protein AVEN_165985-1 [Araneus ventricosus]
MKFQFKRGSFGGYTGSRVVWQVLKQGEKQGESITDATTIENSLRQTITNFIIRISSVLTKILVKPVERLFYNNLLSPEVDDYKEDIFVDERIEPDS